MRLFGIMRFSSPGGNSSTGVGCSFIFSHDSSSWLHPSSGFSCCVLEVRFFADLAWSTSGFLSTLVCFVGTLTVSSLDLSAAGSALASSSRRALTRALLTSEVNSCSLVCCLQVAVVSRPKSPHTLRMSLVDIFVFATSANTSACSSCSGRSASSSIRRRSALADILARFPKNLPVPIACSKVAVSKEALNTNKCWRKAGKKIWFWEELQKPKRTPRVPEWWANSTHSGLCSFAAP